jgi:hypothetical protein
VRKGDDLTTFIVPNVEKIREPSQACSGVPLPFTSSSTEVKSTLLKALKARRVVQIKLYSFFILGARWGLVDKATPRLLYAWKRDPVLLYRRLGGSQGRYRRVLKISPLTGIRSPDLPARSESLHRLIQQLSSVVCLVLS